MLEIIDQVFGKKGFTKYYGYPPRSTWHAYIESCLRTLYYVLSIIAATLVVVALVDREHLTVGMALISVALSGFMFQVTRGFALWSGRENVHSSKN